MPADTAMFSHFHLGAQNFERALAFYRPLMQALGIQARFCDAAHPWAGWQSAPEARPLFLIGAPFNGQRHEPGNGQMLAFLAQDRAAVDRAHAVALAHGGRCEGAPGLRPAYHPHYYGAYFRDTEGNKLCVACHREPVPPPAPAPAPATPAAPPHAMRQVAPQLHEISERVLFGEVWGSPALSARERSLITVAALVALCRLEQLPLHLNKALHHGVSPQELGALATHLAFYAGWPAAASACTLIAAAVES